MRRRRRQEEEEAGGGRQEGEEVSGCACVRVLLSCEFFAVRGLSRFVQWAEPLKIPRIRNATRHPISLGNGIGILKLHIAQDQLYSKLSSVGHVRGMMAACHFLPWTYLTRLAHDCSGAVRQLKALSTTSPLRSALHAILFMLV